MKVKDLIRILKDFNQDCEVFTSEREGGKPYTYFPLETIRCTNLDHVFSEGKVVYANETGNRNSPSIII